MLLSVLLFKENHFGTSLGLLKHIYLIGVHGVDYAQIINVLARVNKPYALSMKLAIFNSSIFLLFDFISGME